MSVRVTERPADLPPSLIVRREVTPTACSAAFELVTPAQPVSPSPPAPLESGQLRYLIPVLPEPWTRRAVEIVVASLLILILAPVLVAVALLVKLTTKGPVLFRQRRVGIDGQSITILKFRSMYVDAAERLAEIHERNEATGPLFKIRKDPRVTPVGRWIRRTSLDELPQLFNVLGGSLSLVGPRPALPEEVARFAGVEHRRHGVRPGLTGLAQVNGRSDLEWADSIRYDLIYVERRSLAMDFAILARTLPAVVIGKGAY